MKLLNFKIQNFRGIRQAEVQLSSDPGGNVITLIGLNESGKTTILEALSHFISEDENTSELVQTVQKKSDVQSLIPKDQKAAFTGRVSIAATAILEPDDIEAMRVALLESHGLRLDVSSLATKLPLERAYLFEDSTFIETKTFWSLNFFVTDDSGNRQDCDAKGDTRPFWLKAVSTLRDRVPRIVYFPTFLFNFPDRIYLESKGDGLDNSLDEYYGRVMQDVLDSQGDNLSLSKHVVDRISRLRQKHVDVNTFFSYLLGTDEKSQIDSVLQKLSNEISQRVFGAWKEVLGRATNNKRVQVEWLVDAARGNTPYLQLSIIDGQSKFALSERSLGFRWFFSFLLFTEFRSNRVEGGATIFLFDEPASNLHSKAQIKLLESFSKISRGNTYIIYSTHSHYMVNPLWLEKAYIVTNSAIDYENEDEVDSFSVRPTNIKAIRYRAFVSKNPTKATYFQPVLDALDVAMSPLMTASKALIVEGKFDYHPIRYLYTRTFGLEAPAIFPANGAGNAGPLINLFRGWGVDFRILLDGDRAGTKAKSKYVNDYGVPESDVFTLGEIDTSFQSKPLEAIYGSDVKGLVHTVGQIQPDKREYSLLFQELLATKSTPPLIQTLASFKPVAEKIKDSFE